MTTGRINQVMLVAGIITKMAISPPSDAQPFEWASWAHTSKHQNKVFSGVVHTKGCYTLPSWRHSSRMMTFQTEPPGTPHIPSSTADFPPQALNINIRSSWGIVLQTANLLLQFQLFSGTAHTPPTIIGLRAQQYTRIGKTPPHSQFWQYLCY